MLARGRAAGRPSAPRARNGRIRHNGEAMAQATPRPSPCDGCDARCCRSYAVYLTGGDVFRIARGTGLAPADFLAYLPQIERTDTGFLLEAGGPTFELVLRAASTDDPLKPCVFLRVDGATGEGRCGIYPVRPGACRRFPAVRRTGGGVGVRGDIVCPEGAWDAHPMDGLSWRVALAREQRDAELYAVVVGEWNARVEAAGPHGARTVDQYLDHLSDAYGWIAQLQRAASPGGCAGPALLLRVGEALREFPAPW